MEQLNSKKKLKNYPPWITFSRQLQVGDVTLQRNATCTMRTWPCIVLLIKRFC